MGSLMTELAMCKALGFTRVSEKTHLIHPSLTITWRPGRHLSCSNSKEDFFRTPVKRKFSHIAPSLPRFIIFFPQYLGKRFWCTLQYQLQSVAEMKQPYFFPDCIAAHFEQVIWETAFQWEPCADQLGELRVTVRDPELQ